MKNNKTKLLLAFHLCQWDLKLLMTDMKSLSKKKRKKDGSRTCSKKTDIYLVPTLKGQKKKVTLPRTVSLSIKEEHSYQSRQISP
jgi:hypothetical protein